MADCVKCQKPDRTGYFGYVRYVSKEDRTVTFIGPFCPECLAASKLKVLKARVNDGPYLTHHWKGVQGASQELLEQMKQEQDAIQSSRPARRGRGKQNR